MLGRNGHQHRGVSHPWIERSSSGALRYVSNESVMRCIAAILQYTLNVRARGAKSGADLDIELRRKGGAFLQARTTAPRAQS